jgi:hypothetical protein
VRECWNDEQSKEWHKSITPLLQYSITPCLVIPMRSEELPKKIEVTAYSGHKANERPLSFMVDDRMLEVRDIIDRWYGVDHDYFKVLASDGTAYLLRWNRLLDTWFLVRIYEKEGKH